MISQEVARGNTSLDLMAKKAAGDEYHLGNMTAELLTRIDSGKKVFNGCYQSRLRWSTARAFDSLDLLEYVNYRRLLSDAASSGRADQVSLVLDFVTVEGKMKWARGHQTSDDRVEVTIKVVDSLSRELSGYIPFCKPFLSTDSTLFEQFDPTNFAKKRIKAGWKLFWIEKNGKRIGSRQEKIFVLDENKVIYFQTN
jgi:hypothetical protein